MTVIVCYYHVMCEFQIEPPSIVCLNIKELLDIHLVYELSSCGFESRCCHCDSHCFCDNHEKFFPSGITNSMQVLKIFSRKQKLPIQF